MSDDSTLAMDDEDVDAFLASRDTGVLAFSTGLDEPPHSIPVSFGYDEQDRAFFFRLSVGGGRRKERLLDCPVTLTVYDETGEGWQSVVATGELEETTEESIATETLEGLERVHIPIVDIFEHPSQDVTFRFFRLTPAELTGRKES